MATVIQCDKCKQLITSKFKTTITIETPKFYSFDGWDYKTIQCDLCVDCKKKLFDWLQISLPEDEDEYEKDDTTSTKGKRW